VGFPSGEPVSTATAHRSPTCNPLPRYLTKLPRPLSLRAAHRRDDVSAAAAAAAQPSSARRSRTSAVQPAISHALIR
jgi:hypothetical protein